MAAGLMSGCATERVREPASVARFFLESANGEGVSVTLPRSDVTIAIGVKPVITEFDLANVEIAEVELGRCLMFQLTAAANRDLYRLTAAHQGRRLVLAIDGRPLGARRIERPLGDGAVLIFVEVNDGELPDIVRALRTGIAVVREGRK